MTHRGGNNPGRSKGAGEISTRCLRSGRTGFSLIELLVVMVVICLIAGITLPSIIRLFTIGAIEQSRNILSGQLSAARAIAIQQNTYAGVHVQRSADNALPGRRGRFFSAVVTLDGKGQLFILADGYAPRSLPVPAAAGAMVRGLTITDDTPPTYIAGDDSGVANIRDFTTFTVVFAPDGTPASMANGGNIDFDQKSPFNPTEPATYLWDRTWANQYSSSDSRQGVMDGIVLFDFNEYQAKPAPEDKAQYLMGYGNILIINRYTGQLLGQ